MNAGWWIIAKDNSMESPATGRVLCVHPDDGRLAVNLDKDGGWCREHNDTDPHNSYWIAPSDIIFAAQTQREITEYEKKHEAEKAEAEKNVELFKKNIKRTFRDVRPLAIAFDTPASLIEPHTRAIVFWRGWSGAWRESELMRKRGIINDKAVYVSIFRPLVLIVPFIPNQNDIDAIKTLSRELVDEEDTIGQELSTITANVAHEETEKTTRMIESLELQATEQKKTLSVLQSTLYIPDPAIISAIQAKYETVKVAGNTIYAITKQLKIKNGARNQNIGRWRVEITDEDIKVHFAAAGGNATYHPHISAGRVCGGNTAIQTHLKNHRYAEVLIVLLDILENYSRTNPYISITTAREARKEAEKNINIITI